MGLQQNKLPTLSFSGVWWAGMDLGGVIECTCASAARLGDVCVHNHVLQLHSVPAFVFTGFG